MECPDEQVMLDLVAGRIPPSETALRDHLDTCASCQDLVVALSSSARPPAPGAAAGRTIGRYIVGSEIGRGAMATVYAARDPELDRDIALKLVQFRDAGSSADRLIREARAMAKLAHPNVTRIYDVGTEGDAVFLAMELVTGADLAHWLRGHDRSWREVATVFAAAADGLAAAHGQRLIHRDFKPSNVLVGDDGRVLVTDFGLVHSPSDADAELDIDAALDGPDALALTRTGAIVGTPAYMAPELLDASSPADELTDQFSFGVSLFEALYRVRPFAGDDLLALRDNVVAHRVRALPSGHDVPRWLQQIALRAIGPRAGRFGSMAEIASALRSDPRRRRRVLAGIAASVVLAAAGSVVAATQLGTPAADPCDAGAEQIAAVWSPWRAAQLGLAFTGTRVPYAPDAWRSTAARLDRYATDWSAGYRAACQATRSGAQSGELLDRRMQCLGARRHELDQLVTLFAGPDRSIVARAPQSADALGRITDCANTVALGTLTPPPANADPAAIDRVRARIARLNVLRNSANPQNVLDEAAQVLAEAKQLDYAPLTAEASVAVAIVHMVANQTKEAASTIDDAVVSAEAGRHFRAKAHALAVAMELAYNTGDLDGAVSKDRLARAALAAIGGDAKLEADLESVLGWIADRKHDAPAAERHLRRALELRIAALGEHDLATARAHANLGATIGNAGDMPAALAEIERALAIERAQLGDKHPAVAQTLGNISAIESALGKPAQAIARGTEALQLLEASMPQAHPATAFATLQLAGAYHQAHDYEAALRYQRLAVSRYEAAVGPDHVDLGRALTNLSATLAELERHGELVTVARRALAIQEKAVGASSPATATIRNNLAVGLVGTGKLDEGLQQFERALALREQVWGKTDPRLLSTLLGIASAHASRKDRRKQLATLERAAAVAEHAKSPRDQSLAAKTQFELAMLVTDKRRARQLAERALALYRALDRETEVAELERWLARR